MISTRLTRYSLYLCAFSLPLSKALLSIFLGSATIFFFLKKISESKNKSSSRLTNIPMNKPILYFLVFCILSLLWGSHFSTNVRGIVKFIEGFLLLFIILDTFKTPEAMKPLLLSLLIGGGVTSLNGLIQFYLGNGWWFLSGPSYGSRIISTFKDPTTFSAYLALILPLMFLFFKDRIAARSKFIYLTSSLVTLIAFYLCYSRNTLFFLLLSIYTIFLFFNKKLSFFIKTTIFSLTIVLFFALSPRLFQNTALLERFYLWKIALNMVKDAPLLGHGLNSYSKINKQYFPPRPEDMPYASGSYLYLAYPHNSYLKLWVEIGLIGLLLYLYIYYCFFKYAFRIINRSPGEIRFKLCLYLMSISTLLTSTFLDTFLEGTQTRVTLWLIMGLMMVELREAEQASQSERVFVTVPEINVSQAPSDVPQT